MMTAQFEKYTIHIYMGYPGYQSHAYEHSGGKSGQIGLLRNAKLKFILRSTTYLEVCVRAFYVESPQSTFKPGL